MTPSRRKPSFSTLDEARAYEKDILVPSQVAKLINADAQYIRLQARADPRLLGFPVIVVGTRTKIPRLPFIRFMEGNLGRG